MPEKYADEITTKDNGFSEVTLEEHVRVQTQEQVQEILGNPPGWMLRWGIFLISIVVVFGICLAWWIKFPDIIEAPVVLTAIAPPIEVIATVSGKLAALEIQDQEWIETGQVIGWIENTANRNDVELLENYLLNIDHEIHHKSYLEIQPPNELQLGSFNIDYLQWQQNLNELQNFLKQNTVFQKMSSIEKEIDQITQLNQSIEKQGTLFKQEVALVEKDVLRHRQLNQDGSVSDQELERMEGQLIQQKRSLEAMHASLINNEIRIEQLNTQFYELKANRSDELKDKLLIFQQQRDKLLAFIEDWKYQFLIIAPISGYVSLNQIRADQQFIQAGEGILSIVPPEAKSRIFARCKIPVGGIGKIEKGLKVNIRLDAYPYREYGIITAKVDRLSLIPMSEDQSDQYYILEADLPEQLQTTYEKKISFKHEMSGQAHIITEDRSILSRIFDQFQSIVKNN